MVKADADSGQLPFRGAPVPKSVQRVATNPPPWLCDSSYLPPVINVAGGFFYTQQPPTEVAFFIEIHMRTDITLNTTIGAGFKARIDAELDIDGEVSDVQIFSLTTGEDLTTAFDSNSSERNQAWNEAERFAASMIPTRKVRRAIAANTAAMCHDTPYACGVGA